MWVGCQQSDWLTAGKSETETWQMWYIEKALASEAPLLWESPCLLPWGALHFRPHSRVHLTRALSCVYSAVMSQTQTLGKMNFVEERENQWGGRRNISLKERDQTKEIKPVNPKGTQPWIFIGRTDAEAEAPTVWPPDAKNWLIRKDPDLGKIEGRRSGRQRRRWLGGITESMDTNLHKLRDGEGQRSLVCGSPWGYKESDRT